MTSIPHDSSRRQGIETTYKGTLFRSRLEARWAAFFDALGWQWEYEPFDADGYIPDFALLDARLLVEVKPSSTVDELRPHLRHAARAVTAHWQHDVAAVGISPTLALVSRRHHRAGFYAPEAHTWPADAGQIGRAWAAATNAVRWNAPVKATTPTGECFCGRPWGEYRDHIVDHTRQGQAMAASPAVPPPAAYFPGSIDPRYAEELEAYEAKRKARRAAWLAAHPDEDP